MGVVVCVCFMGKESFVEFCMEYDGSILKVIVLNVFLLLEGMC